MSSHTIVLEVLHNAVTELYNNGNISLLLEKFFSLILFV